MYSRNLAPAIEAALADTAAVFLAGPRQVGKSTLARALAGAGRPERRYLTFDDAATLAAAAADPQGFVEAIDSPVVLDEVQRVPAIFLALKLAIDRQGQARQPGRYLLTGSADPLLVPAFSDSLAGRIEIHTLWGLSQGELAGTRDDFVDRLFDGASAKPLAGLTAPENRQAVVDRALAGGFPEVLARKDEGRRRDWLGAYVTALLARDVRDLSQVEGLALFPRLLSLLAARSATALNAADLGRDAGLPYATLRRYLALLEALHLVRLVPSWSRSATSRLVKAPKILLTDPALVAHLSGRTRSRMAAEPDLAGAILESFVGMEIVKQLGWATTRATLFWFRTQTGHEVDFVLEADDGRLVGVEVKASTAVRDSDFQGLRTLANVAGKRFFRGILLYTGRESLPFGKGLEAVPMPTLWLSGSASS